MVLNFNNIQINEELEKLLPPLSKEDYNILKQSLLKNGFDQKFGRIKVWFDGECDFDNKSVGYIIDGHNRYRICKNIILNWIVTVLKLYLWIQKKKLLNGCLKISLQDEIYHKLKSMRL